MDLSRGGRRIPVNRVVSDEVQVQSHYHRAHQLSAHYWDAGWWVIHLQSRCRCRYLGEPADPGYAGECFSACGFTALLLLLRRSQHKLAPADREYLKFCRYLANQGLARSEGPISYARRVVTLRRPGDIGYAVTDAYTELYRRPEDVDTLRKAVRRVRLSVLAGA